MYKFIVAFILVMFDYVIGVDNIQIDLLPDFIGYGIMIYGMYKIKKNNKKNENLGIVCKQSIIVFGISIVVTYIMFLLSMYGVLYSANNGIVATLSLIVDLLMLVSVFMFIQVLKALQGISSNFQIKRLHKIWIITILCTLCQNIALAFSLGEMTMTFIIFQKLIQVVYLVYVFASAKTYKLKFDLDVKTPKS